MPHQNLENLTNVEDLDISLLGKKWCDEQPADDEGAGRELVIKIKHKRPLDLTELTESLRALDDEYRRFVAADPESAATPGLRFFVREARPDGTVVELTSRDTSAPPSAEETKNLDKFARYLKAAYRYFTGQSAEAPAALARAGCDNFIRMLETTARDPGSHVVVSVLAGGRTAVSFSLNSLEANAAQNVIRRESAGLRG